MVILLCSVSNIYGETVDTNTSICYTPEIASKIVVDLQKYNITTKELEATKELNGELSKQIESLKQVIQLEKEQINVLNQAIVSYKNIIEVQKQGYEEQLKNSKPSLINTILKSAGLVGTGILIGAALMI